MNWLFNGDKRSRLVAERSTGDISAYRRQLGETARRQCIDDQQTGIFGGRTCVDRGNSKRLVSLKQA